MEKDKRIFSQIRDWKLNDIFKDDIVKTQQGTLFVVDYRSDIGWFIIQANKSHLPDLQGDWFKLEKYMQPNLEVIGNIHEHKHLIQ